MYEIRSVDELLVGVNPEEARLFAKALRAADHLDWTSQTGEQVVLTQFAAELLGNLILSVLDGHVVIIEAADRQISPEDAAKILGVSRPTVYKLMDTGRLRFWNVGRRHRRVDYRQVIQLLGQRRATAEQARMRAASATHPPTHATENPTPEEIFAAATAHRRGDGKPIESLRAAGLRSRARDAAKRARGD